jgi:hypothetical protein
MRCAGALLGRMGRAQMRVLTLHMIRRVLLGVLPAGRLYRAGCHCKPRTMHNMQALDICLLALEAPDRIGV